MKQARKKEQKRNRQKPVKANFLCNFQPPYLPPSLPLPPSPHFRFNSTLPHTSLYLGQPHIISLDVSVISHALRDQFSIFPSLPFPLDNDLNPSPPPHPPQQTN